MGRCVYSMEIERKNKTEAQVKTKKKTERFVLCSFFFFEEVYTHTHTEFIEIQNEK